MLTAFKGPEAGHLVVVDEGGQVKRNAFLFLFFQKITLSSMLLHRPGFGATMTMVSLALVTPDAGSKKKILFLLGSQIT